MFHAAPDEEEVFGNAEKSAGRDKAQPVFVESNETLYIARNFRSLLTADMGTAQGSANRRPKGPWKENKWGKTLP